MEEFLSRILISDKRIYNRRKNSFFTIKIPGIKKKGRFMLKFGMNEMGSNEFERKAEIFSEKFSECVTDEVELERLRCIAKDPNTSIEVLMELATGRDSEILENVAINLNTPVDVLKKMSKDRDC